MTRTAEIVERLRGVEALLWPGERLNMETLQSWLAENMKLRNEAADHIETLDAARRGEAAIAEEALKARDRTVEALERTLRNFRLLLEQKLVRDAAETIAEAERALAGIGPESEATEDKERELRWEQDRYLVQELMPRLPDDNEQ